jgi:hypothetical protein
MPKASKKQKIVYKENPDEKAEALESFLFGSKQAPASLFEGGGDDGEDTYAGMEDAMRKKTDGEEPIFFEDTKAAELDSEDQEEDGEVRPACMHARACRHA